MHASRNEESDDLLARAVQALRETPLADGPSAVSVSQTVAAVRQVASRPETLMERIRATPWTSKTAALLGLAASGLVLWAVLTSPAGTSLALAQVVDKIASARMVAFDMVLDAPQGKFPVLKAHLIFAEGGRMRADVEDPRPQSEGTASLIANFPAGKSIIISSKAKTAIQGVIKGSDPSMWKESMLDQLRSIAAKGTHELGEKEIDGVRAKGFELAREHVSMRIWANSQTGDPIRIEIPDFFFPPPLGKASVVWTNFKLGEQVDPALFNVEPPAGYLAIKSPIEIDLTSPPSEHVVAILREYAKRSDGAFPAQINDMGESVHKELGKRRGASDDQASAEDARLFSAPFAQLNSYMIGHKSGKDYQYYPGLRLGDKDRVVFWYHDEKTGKYTAVYGDLRVAEVKKEELPADNQMEGEKPSETSDRQSP